jgi:hypothetical protein
VRNYIATTAIITDKKNTVIGVIVDIVNKGRMAGNSIYLLYGNLIPPPPREKCYARAM